MNLLPIKWQRGAKAPQPPQTTTSPSAPIDDFVITHVQSQWAEMFDIEQDKVLGKGSFGEVWKEVKPLSS